jgi:hypothetical protein
LQPKYTLNGARPTGCSDLLLYFDQREEGGADADDQKAIGQWDSCGA